MTVAGIGQIFEEWAPRWTAWDRDNVGLQVGDYHGAVSRILVTLDVTEETVEEAVGKKVDLIVSHHPLLFRPAKSITTSDEAGRIILKLAQKRIALYSAHTNLDFARGGVSFALSHVLGLRRIKFLSPLTDTLCKVAVFVPHTFVDKVSEAMTGAGAGVIGEYTSCSFRVQGMGTFRGSSDTRPFIGSPAEIESADETRVEMIVPRAFIERVVKAMKAVHPYEEVAYDIYPLSNSSPNFGMGAMGELPSLQTLKEFLERTKRTLGSVRLRYTGRLKDRIKSVAVCGGSGSDLLPTAIREGAHVFITSDVRYHAFHEASGKIALVDAGHWETEQVILRPIAERLRAAAKAQKETLSVMITRQSTNPIHFI